MNLSSLTSSLVVTVLISSGCTGDVDENDAGAQSLADAGTGTLVPDFSLQDRNPASSTYNTDVSPRDALNKVSAWYFGHAT